MSRPRHVFCSASCPSPASLPKESGSSCFRVSDGCSGRNSVWMTNRAALFVRSIQFLSSTVMVMISSIKSSIDESVDVMSTSKWSTVVRWLADFCFSSFGSKYRCGKFRSSVSQNSSRSRMLPRYISASLTVVYSSVAVVVTKGNLREINASL